MADQRAQDLLKRFDSLWQHRQMWAATWQELGDYISPRKSNIEVTRSPGQKQTEKLMESTAVHAAEILASSMQGSLTSQSVRWFHFRIPGLPLGVLERMDEWLEVADNIAYDEIRQSNFQAESHEFYHDLAVFGTAAMFIDQKAPRAGKPYSGLVFTTLTPGSYVLDESEEGYVDTIGYKVKLSPRQAAVRFTEEMLPQTVRARLGTQQQDEPGDYIHMIYPRKPAVAAVEVTAPKDRAWASVWISVEASEIVKEGGYHEFPFAVARWTKVSGEKYGRSPGFTALADIKSLNKLRELKLHAMSVMVKPPLKVRDDGVIGAVRLTPGGLTHVRDMEAVDTIQVQARIDVAQMEEKELQAQVRRMFFADQLQLQEGPQMTAYEVQVRYELMQRILGPTLGRLAVEFQQPMLNRVFNLLLRARRFTQPPAELARYRSAGGRIDIQFEGPLARAQRLADTVALQRFLNIAVPVAEIDPSVLDNLEKDEIIRFLAESTGVPQRLITDRDKLEEIRAERAAQQAQQMQAAQMNETMKAAGAGAPALKALMEAQQQGIIPSGGATGAGVPPGGIGLG
jgi:hypothetical protein